MLYGSIVGAGAVASYTINNVGTDNFGWQGMLAGFLNSQFRQAMYISTVACGDHGPLCAVWKHGVALYFGDHVGQMVSSAIGVRIDAASTGRRLRGSVTGYHPTTLEGVKPWNPFELFY